MFPLETVMANMLELDAAIQRRSGDQTLENKRKRSLNLKELAEPSIDFLEEDDQELAEPLNNHKADSYTPELLDKYLGATLLMPQGDGMQRARVLR